MLNLNNIGDSRIEAAGPSAERISTTLQQDNSSLPCNAHVGGHWEDARIVSAALESAHSDMRTPGHGSDLLFATTCPSEKNKAEVRLARARDQLEATLVRHTGRPHQQTIKAAFPWQYDISSARRTAQIYKVQKATQRLSAE
jgi:hypothetical protein